MKAWQYSSASSGLEAKEVPIGEPGKGEVILRVEAAGLCHPDCTIVRGHGDAWISKKPITLGHEVAGTVMQLGPGVCNVKVGDRVVVALPEEAVCLTGFGESLGLGRDGGFAEQTVALAKRLVHLPDHVSFPTAAVSTDSVSTAYHAVVSEGRIKDGVTCAIVGLGGLGLSGAKIAVLQGATVYGVDVDKSKFDAAMKAGVKGCAQSLGELKDVTLDVIVDFAGVGSTTTKAMQVVRPQGCVVLVGLGVASFEVSTNVLVNRNIKLRGSLGSTATEYRQVLKLLADGKLSPLLEEVPFSSLSEALARLDRGEVNGRLFTRPNA